MFEDNHSLPKEFGTPLRKRKYLPNDLNEEDGNCSLARTSITKSSCSPSSEDSPLMQPHLESIEFDIDLCAIMLEDSEAGELCFDFLEKGCCLKESCGL